MKIADALQAEASVWRHVSLRISFGEAVPTAGFANANAYSVRCTKLGLLLQFLTAEVIGNCQGA